MTRYMTDETQALKTLSDTIKLFDNSEKNNCLLIDELKELEKKQMDISHQVELEAKISFREERVYHSRTDIVDCYTEKIR